MKKITAKEFDEKFDNGEDVSEYLSDVSMDFDEFKKQHLSSKVELTLTAKIRQKLLEKADELGINFEDTIKILLAKQLGVL